jgi:hypothetical protein
LAAVKRDLDDLDESFRRFRGRRVKTDALDAERTIDDAPSPDDGGRRAQLNAAIRSRDHARVREVLRAVPPRDG